MANGDGNGWLRCSCGEKHWGVHGAAGLLAVYAPGVSGIHGPLPADAEVLLQRRSSWTLHGGTWGIPGGAKDSHENVVMAALRETWEETGLRVEESALVGVSVDAHPRSLRPDWTYTTAICVMDKPEQMRLNNESDEVRWVRVDDVPRFRLHPGLRDAWAQISGPRTRLVIDLDHVVAELWPDDHPAAAIEAFIELLSARVGSFFFPDGRLLGMVHGTTSIQGSFSAHPAVLVTSVDDPAQACRSNAEEGDITVTHDAGVDAWTSKKVWDLLTRV